MKLEIKKYSVEILLAVAVIGLALQIVEVAAKSTDQDLTDSATTLVPSVTDTPAVAASKATVNDPTSLGEMLYNNHCTTCHESNAHIRAKHQVHTRNDITHWVTRWSTYLKLKWTNTDIEAVTDYLNKSYYQLVK